jgi:hypothetical protein
MPSDLAISRALYPFAHRTFTRRYVCESSSRSELKGEAFLSAGRVAETLLGTGTAFCGIGTMSWHYH